MRGGGTVREVGTVKERDRGGIVRKRGGGPVREKGIERGTERD